MDWLELFCLTEQKSTMANLIFLKKNYGGGGRGASNMW